MTNDAATDVRQWLVSARGHGELLTSRARSGGTDLVMVGVPSGYSAEEVESWLRDLLGMAVETSSGETGDRPIPALLHHLLTGLLFSHAELWDRGGATAPASMAFVRTPGEVAFGWVGAPPPDLWLDDHRSEVEWVRIRDQEGREAFALAIDAAHRVRVHFTIPAGATVDGAWVPDAQAGDTAEQGLGDAAIPERGSQPASAIARAIGARAVVAESSASHELEPAGGAPRPTPPGPAAGSGDGWTVVYEASEAEPAPAPPRAGGWWSNMFGWVSRSRSSRRDEFPDSAPADDLPADLPESIPPTPEPADLTARAISPVRPGDAPGSGAGIELTPLAPEEPAAAAPHAPREPEAADWRVESARLEPRPERARHAPSTAARPAPSPASTPSALASVPAPPAPPAAPSLAAAAPEAAPISAPVVPAPSPVANAGPEPPFLQPDMPARRPDFAADGARVPRRPRWNEPAASAPERPVWQRPWAWAALVAVLFVAGWMLGGTGDEHAAGEPGRLARALGALGLGGARFEAVIESHPPGAWITVDGKELARRTPATVSLSPGTHRVGLGFAEHGGAEFEVRGARGEKVRLDAPMWGALEVYSGDGGIPVAVTVDGIARGIAPLTVDSLSPGTHEVRFSGPGLQPWGQTVQVRVREATPLAARAVTSPATGLLEVRALWTDAEGSESLSGAAVYVDGERRGVTPLSLELPRGPHSVRIETRGESSPVQVLDLPGGNQRFANFELGLGIDRPTLKVLDTPVRVPLDQPTVVSASLQGVSAAEVREMWLHVRQPDAAWRRYPMVMMKAPGGLVGTAVFPNTLLDAGGRTPFYVSAANQTGDEFFSEILTAQEQGTPARR